MPRTSSLPLVDRILEGQLERQLTDRRAAGDSYAAIARWLGAVAGIDVTSETVRQWCLSLGIEKPVAQAGSATAYLVSFVASFAAGAALFYGLAALGQ